MTRVMGLGGIVAAGLGGYAFAFEPVFRLTTKTWKVHADGWPKDAPPLRIALVADIHACSPSMTLDRVAEIVTAVNALAPDITLLLGDYAASHPFATAHYRPAEIAEALQGFTAPLGAYAILGNHDWWDGAEAHRIALTHFGYPVLENEALRFKHKGQPFWLAGLGDQWAYRLGKGQYQGVDDLPGTLAKMPGDDPAILMIHEPDAFVDVPSRVTLTVAGHTHGGQVRIPGLGRPVVPSKYGQRFAYGHIVEDGRQMIVSGGLGCSLLPVRFLVPPEITVVELAGA